MIQRPISLLAVAICVFGFMPQADARKIKRQMFIEPSLRMALSIPYGWSANPGLGNRIVDLINDSQGKMHVISSSIADVKRLIAELYSGARIEDTIKQRLGNRDAFITFFDLFSEKNLKGAIIKINGGNCDVNILCTDVHKDFAPTFLACRELVSNMRCDLEADPERWDKDLKRVMRRGVFAYLDGRGGCAGVSEEPRRMAMIAREIGKLSDADKLESMALMLSMKAKTNKALLSDVPKSVSKFFSLLMRSQLALESGDVDKAKEMISKAESHNRLNSRLLLAIKIKLACRQKDVASAEQFFEVLEKDICGRSGSMAAYELGSAVETFDQERALSLFERAIDADPAFVPPYISLGKALLRSGMPASSAFARMKALLSRAPAVPWVEDFKRRFETRAEHIATVEKNSHP